MCLCVRSLSSEFYFIGNKIAADCFKDEITPSLKANDRLKFAQDMALNNVIEKGKPRCKLSYEVLKEEYGYYTLLEISTYPKLIPLKGFFYGIHYCVTVVGKWIFYSNFRF